MADFAQVEPGRRAGPGAEPGAFMQAYLGNRAEAVEITLEASPLTEPLRQMATEASREPPRSS